VPVWVLFSCFFVSSKEVGALALDRITSFDMDMTLPGVAVAASATDATEAGP